MNTKGYLIDALVAMLIVAACAFVEHTLHQERRAPSRAGATSADALARVGPTSDLHYQSRTGVSRTTATAVLMKCTSGADFGATHSCAVVLPSGSTRLRVRSDAATVDTASFASATAARSGGATPVVTQVRDDSESNLLAADPQGWVVVPPHDYDAGVKPDLAGLPAPYPRVALLRGTVAVTVPVPDAGIEAGCIGESVVVDTAP